MLVLKDQASHQDQAEQHQEDECVADQDDLHELLQKCHSSPFVGILIIALESSANWFFKILPWGIFRKRRGLVTGPSVFELLLDDRGAELLLGVLHVLQLHPTVVGLPEEDGDEGGDESDEVHHQKLNGRHSDPFVGGISL